MLFEEQKYKIGEIVDINSWGGLKTDFKIIDIDEIYHPRLREYGWGYKMDRINDTGLNFHYIPEGYLRKSKRKLRLDKLERIIEDKVDE